jgi:DegV family protein with EDD domain
MVHIVTDTTAVLPQDIADRYDIPIVPQVIHFGQDSFLECQEMDSRMFMERLLTSKTLPQTAAPPPELFHEHFVRFAADGEPILCIHPSSKVSGTVRSASVARQAFPDADIRVMDTLAVGAPLGRMVAKAAEWADGGVDVDAIWQRLQAMIPRVRIYFTVDTLEYLQRGGRIGGAKALLGSILRIRPVLAWREGQVEPGVNERTTRRAIQRLVSLACEQAPRDRDPMFSVMHAAAPLAAQEIVGQLRDEFGARPGGAGSSEAELDVWVTDMVPAIVTHAGPGAVAVGFFV